MLTVHIGSDLTGFRGHADVKSPKEASEVYCRRRDEEGEGASTWHNGRVFENGKLTHIVSYNGKVWDVVGLSGGPDTLLVRAINDLGRCVYNPCD